MTDCYYGVKVSPMVNRDGSTFYAEVFPSAPVIRYVKTAKLLYRIQFGRKGLFTRWWFEIHLDTPDDIGTHYYQHDGGAFSFRKAVKRAGQKTDLLYWNRILGKDDD